MINIAREAIKENIKDSLHLLLDVVTITKSGKSDFEIKARLEKRMSEYGRIGTIEHITQLLHEIDCRTI